MSCFVKSKDQYLMFNIVNGISVVCTTKFVKYWKARGFKVMGKSFS